MDTVLGEHPLAATFERLAEPLPGCVGTVDDPGGGWTSLAEITDPDVLAGLLAEKDRSYRGGAALAGHALVSDLAGPPTMLLAGMAFAEHRLPLVEPDELRVRFVQVAHGRRVGAVSVHGGRMLTLPDDEAACAPGARTVPDIAALQVELTDLVVRLFEPVVAEVSRQSRRGRRALWQDLADRIGLGFLQPGKHRGTPEQARREADATLAAAPRPLRATLDWLPVPHDGAEILFRRKSVCCLNYKAADPNEDYCTTCPLIERAETVRRIQRKLDARA